VVIKVLETFKNKNFRCMFRGRSQRLKQFKYNGGFSFFLLL